MNTDATTTPHKNNAVVNKCTRYRVLGKYDMQITPEESIKFKEQLSCVKMPCGCCANEQISEIVGRTIYECMTCFCCADDFYMCDEYDNLCRVLDTSTKLVYIAKKDYLAQEYPEIATDIMNYNMDRPA